MNDPRLEPFEAAILHAVGNATAARDLGLMLHLAPDEPGETILRSLRDGLVDGVLIGTSAVRTWADDLIDSDLPTVLIGTHPSRLDVIGVDVENVWSSASVVRHLFEQGCERVGCITGRLDRAAGVDRAAGYRLAHREDGRPIEEQLLVHGDFSRRSGSAAAAELLDLGVDGIFASNDDMAIGAIWTARQRGLSVPDDLLVAGFDGITVGDDIVDDGDQRALTTIVQPYAELADVSLDLLDRLIRGDVVESVVLESHLAIGASTTRARRNR